MPSLKEKSLYSNANSVLDLLAPLLNAKPFNTPLVIGLTGLQGSGKSTWATALVHLLRTSHNLNAITVSLDDFYKTHDDLVGLRTSCPENKLFRTRGQAGTHDEKLAKSFFEDVRKREGTLRIPVFDKSRFKGEGDRASNDQWPVVELPVDVIVFEGWCVGFQAIEEDVVRKKHEISRLRQKEKKSCGENGLGQNYSTNTLADHSLSDLLQLNTNLKRYNDTFMGPSHFDCLLHLDTDNIQNVYTWRLDQEDALRARTGGHGMTAEEVIAFVRDYMPAYELYLDGVRAGFHKHDGEPDGKIQVRVCLDLERNVVACDKI